MSDTPETDAEEFKADRWCPKRGFYLLMGSCVPAEIARQLERERNEARALAEKYRNLAAATQQQADEHRLPWETITNQPKQ